jgi:predicted NBD/HSP70 family sugar kinase
MHPLLLQKPRIVPVLDEDFRPAILGNRAFRDAVGSCGGKPPPVTIAIERNDGAISAHVTQVFPEGHKLAAANLSYVERLVKVLLWKYGGFRIVLGGPKELGEHIRKQYAPDGPLTFDAKLMGDVYERTFTVETNDTSSQLTVREPKARPRGRHLDGCRIGFDAGASDRKCVAVVEGEVVFSEEVPWNPSKQADPEYHYSGIRDAFRHAAEKMPRVDAIGVSAAGVYINNRAMVASLFRSVPRDLFKTRVHDIFLNLQKEWKGVPMEVANDGEVAALAGSMGLNDTKVLGIALGSSEAGGYVTADGCITDWLNELAFPPVDFNPTAPVDEWSGDRGCGGEYFSQKAAVRLAVKAGIPLEASWTMAEQLKAIQGLLDKGDGRARKIFETIGVYMGYGIAQYADFYDLRHVMLMGRVVSGEGGNIILDLTRAVLEQEFPDLARKIQVHLPGESSRRVGQAVAAASLPWVK